MRKLFLFLALLGTATAQSAPTAILPDKFSGWQKSADARVVKDPAAFDQKNAAALKEYGFNAGESATFVREDRKITIKAARFEDATGGYGSFTFYLAPNLDREKLCDGGASGDNRVLFYCGNVLLDVSLDHQTAMSGADMRALASAMPKLTGNQANKPTLPLYLPREQREDARLVLGPAALALTGSPVPASVIDFSRSAEVAVSKFERVGSSGVTTLISYPTPQIATLQLKKIQDWGEAASKAAQQQPVPTSALPADSPAPDPMPTFAAKRTGAMVAVVTGDIDARQAENVLSDINYDAEVTWSEPTGMGKRENIGNLVYEIFILIGILLSVMLVMGLAFAGFRLMIRNTFRAKNNQAPDEVEFIRLNLRD